jgi:PilZ domain
MPPEPANVDPNREQRRHERVDLFQEIVCASGAVEARSQVADLSVGGMFIDTPRPPFPTGTRITVRFALRAGGPPMALDAEVHYVQERIGMGIRFLDVADDDVDRITAFVEESAHRNGGRAPVRKSARVFVELPVRVRGAWSNGSVFDERTSIITLSKHGACLVSQNSLDVGMRLSLETGRGAEFKGNVVWVGSEATRSVGQVGVKCRGLAQSLGFQFP